MPPPRKSGIIHRYSMFTQNLGDCSLTQTKRIYRHQAATFEEVRTLIDHYIYFYNNQRILLKAGAVPLTLRHSV